MVVDPYKLLDPLFGGNQLDDAIQKIEGSQGEVVANGSKAVLAYARLQDSKLYEQEIDALRQQLLRYCELDTLAMVMVYQALRGWMKFE